MIWKSSIHQCESLYVHVMMIGGHINKIIDVKVLSKTCATCLCAEGRVEKVLEHGCPNNYEGNRQGMEATSGLELVNKIKKRDDCHIIGGI